MTEPAGPRRGLMIILSSPSGAGKSTLARRMLDWDRDIRFSVSATTRPARSGEVDGRDYHFVTEAEFQRMVRDGEMLEHASVFGNFYGSPLGPVKRAVEAGTDVFFDIDWQGADQIRNSALKEYALSIFLLPPSIAELGRRLEARAQDDSLVIAERMRRSWDEISHWESYDYVLVNDDLDVCGERLKTIIAAERLRRRRQPGIADHVRGLRADFEEGT